MNYGALIHNRRSVREFKDKIVPIQAIEEVMAYYETSVMRLLPEIYTRLRFFGTEAREALEGAAGYNRFLVGAPQYMVLLSDQHPHAHLNAGFIMEDLILKLADLDIDSCWITFSDSNDIKQALKINSELDVAAIVAFGYGKKAVRRLRLNIRSMSNVDVAAMHQYMEPKKSVYDIAYADVWGNIFGLDGKIGFFDDVLWESLYAVSNAPSYLNRQAYAFLFRDDKAYFVELPDAYNNPLDGALSLGAALQHFSCVAGTWLGKLKWELEPEADLDLPENHRLVAAAVL